MITIRPLRQLTRTAAERVIGGYISSQKYYVARSLSGEKITITLTLVDLPGPYVKRFPLDDETFELYQNALSLGYSLGAYHGETLVGLAIAEARRWNNSLWVWEFGVAENYRRQGIGRLIMESLAEMAAEKGLRCLVCETQNTNVPAINFYRQLGFEIDGIDLTYYTNHDIECGEVALFMKRKFDPASG